LPPIENKGDTVPEMWKNMMGTIKGKSPEQPIMADDIRVVWKNQCNSDDDDDDEDESSNS